jgi:hypothetical protein
VKHTKKETNSYLKINGKVVDIKDKRWTKIKEIYEQDYHLGCNNWPNCDEAYCDLLEISGYSWEDFCEIEENYIYKILTLNGYTLER